MDFSQASGSVVHQTTGRRMHIDDVPIPTIWSAKDANSVVWGLANLCQKAGVSLSQFDPDDPDSYDKIFQAVKATVRDESVVSLGYNPNKRYTTSFFVYVDGNYYECYHPNGCLDKDPRDPANRPEGWTNTDPSQPYYWIKIGKFLSLPEIGVPLPFPTLNLREGVIKYNGEANLHKDKFWRLAELYPDLINSNFITIADLRAKYIQGLDDGRGVDVGRILLSHQGDSMREIEGSFKTAIVHQNDASSGVFGNVGEDGIFREGIATHQASATNSTSNEAIRFKASRVVPTSPRFTVENLAFLQATRI